MLLVEERGTLRIIGGSPAVLKSTVEAFGDHRLAMATAALASATGTLRSDGGASMDVSFPGFVAALSSLQRP